VKPQIKKEDAISILISAEYLRIPTLVEECLQFFVNNMNQILEQPLDLTCISNKLLKRMIKLIDLDHLEKVVDKRDRILSRIYMIKLETLIEDESNMIYKCLYCSSLLTMD